MRSQTWMVYLGVGLALGIPAPAALAQDAQPDAREGDSARSDARSPVHRGRDAEREDDAPEGGPGGPGGPAVFPRDFRTIDAEGNNPMHPEWGAAETHFRRAITPDYADGVSEPSGADRPSARLVSNLIVAQGDVSIPNTLGYSDYIWQWGQFLDHDITETPVTDPGEAFDIPVPTGDAWFDPFATGVATIPLDRSAWDLVDGVRRQINLLTAYIDASNVYGSEEDRAMELRALDGTGKLKTSAGDLLPYNTNGFQNAPTAYDPSYFLAGDIRANEQVGLTAMHTLFVREHNRLAEQIAADLPHLSGDEIYEHARAIVAAQMQAITYNEFLPKLLGPGAMPRYTGYRPNVNASIANIFANAGYRVGHTMLSTQILRLDANGDAIDAGHLDLASAFFAPSEIESYGIDSVLRGLAAQHAQDIDTFIVDDLRNFLFGPPGSGGFDLASLNIQRGRDHGLPTYNAVRVAYGRPAASDFFDVNPDPEVAQRLASAYASVDQIDPWVGLLAENHRAGAFVGETLFRVLRDQFVRLRDGDRFWYEIYLPRELAREVERTSLSDIIRRNTDIGDELPDDVFTVEIICAADMAEPYGVLNLFDVIEFMDRFVAHESSADINADGRYDFTDVSAYIQMFIQGCEG